MRVGALWGGDLQRTSYTHHDISGGLFGMCTRWCWCWCVYVHIALSPTSDPPSDTRNRCQYADVWVFRALQAQRAKREAASQPRLEYITGFGSNVQNTHTHARAYVWQERSRTYASALFSVKVSIYASLLPIALHRNMPAVCSSRACVCDFVTRVYARGALVHPASHRTPPFPDVNGNIPIMMSLRGWKDDVYRATSLGGVGSESTSTL